MEAEKQPIVDKNEEKSSKWCSRNSAKFKLFLGTAPTILSTIFGACALTCLQIMSEVPPVLEINAVTYTVALVTSCLILLFRREIPMISFDYKWSLLSVCVLMVLYDVFLFNNESAFLPLGSIEAVQYGSTIIFSLFLSWKFLNENITCLKVCVVFIALIGLSMNVASNLPIFNKLSGDGEQYQYNSASGSNFTTVQKERETQFNGTIFLVNFLPFVFLAISSLSNAVYITILSASGLESEKATTILFWLFVFGSPVLWILSAIFEDMIFPKSLQDKLLLITCGLCTTSQTYFYIMAAQLLYPTVLSVAETCGIPVFFIVQISFLNNISKPENLPLQLVSVILIFLVSVGLPVLEIIGVSEKEMISE